MYKDAIEMETFVKSAIMSARNQFFPGWFRYEGLEEQRETDKPFYHVICFNGRDYEIAQHVKPDCVRAEIELRDPFVKRREKSQ